MLVTSLPITEEEREALSPRLVALIESVPQLTGYPLAQPRKRGNDKTPHAYVEFNEPSASGAEKAVMFGSWIPAARLVQLAAMSPIDLLDLADEALLKKEQADAAAKGEAIAAAAPVAMVDPVRAAMAAAIAEAAAKGDFEAVAKLNASLGASVEKAVESGQLIEGESVADSPNKTAVSAAVAKVQEKAATAAGSR